MSFDDWLIERWRITFVIFFALVAGLLTNQWLLCLLIASISYTAWLLYKINQLYLWLKKNGKEQDLKMSSGIFEHIAYHVIRIEKQRSRSKKRMKNILRRMQGIIKNLPYATLVLNEYNEIDWANQEAIKLLKINIKKDRGQRVENLLRDPQIIYLLEKGKGQEIILNAPHNQQIQLAIQLIIVQKKLKLLIARDITEQMLLDANKKHFIANASHELRTPLTVIMGYFEIMQSTQDFPPYLIPALQSSVDQALNMQNIIEDLLTLSRLENTRLEEQDCEQINLAEIIRTLCQNEAQLNETVHCNYQNINQKLLLNGAKTEISSLCSNLIRNAIRYNPQGTPIIISWQKDQQGAGILQVIDQGKGIASEHLSQLTKRFYRVDKGRSRSTGGTGLGLAIVKHIVERHQSILEIESEINKGSTFKIIFPKKRIF